MGHVGAGRRAPERLGALVASRCLPRPTCAAVLPAEAARSAGLQVPRRELDVARPTIRSSTSTACGPLSGAPAWAARRSTGATVRSRSSTATGGLRAVPSCARSGRGAGAPERSSARPHRAAGRHRFPAARQPDSGRDPARRDLAIGRSSRGEAAVMARHPEVEWLGGRPVSGTIHPIRAARETCGPRAETSSRPAAGVRPRCSGRWAWPTSAPRPRWSSWTCPPRPRAHRRSRGGGVDGPGGGLGTEPTAGPRWMRTGRPGRGTRTGIRVGVVEYHNVRGSGDLAGKVVASRSATGSLAYAPSGSFDHPTWVAGAIAGQLVLSRRRAGAADRVVRYRRLHAVAHLRSANHRGGGLGHPPAATRTS